MTASRAGGIGAVDLRSYLGVLGSVGYVEAKASHERTLAYRQVLRTRVPSARTLTSFLEAPTLHRARRPRIDPEKHVFIAASRTNPLPRRFLMNRLFSCAALSGLMFAAACGGSE